MPKVLERVSQREYAKYLGVSNEAVSRAVKDGRIKKGWDAKQQKIIVLHANNEFGFMHKENLPGAEPLPEVNDEDEDDFTEDEESDDSAKLNNRSSYMEAKRVREINLAKLSDLDYKERVGDLVRKDVVFKELFAFGQQMRVSLLAIPDRTIDNILAAKTRGDAHNILTEAIHGTLEDLTSRELEFKQR